MYKRLLHTVLFLALALTALRMSAQLVINEVSYAKSELNEENGFEDDWIEIYNPNDHSVQLLNWRLSDDAEELDKYIFPDTVILSLGFLIVRAQDCSPQVPEQLCTNFKIENGQEHLFLLRPDGSLCDALVASSTLISGSYGRFPDGNENWYHMEKPTPYLANSSRDIVYPEEEDQLIVSNPSGLYSSPFELSVTSIANQTTIRYTRNGEVPQVHDPIYSAPLSISSESKLYSGIAYTPTSNIWKTPKGGVAINEILRFRPFQNNIPIGNTQTYTYIVHPEVHKKYPCPVVSLIIPDSTLFSAEEGIYVFGNSEYGNYQYKGKEWERKGSLNIISDNTGLALSSDIRLRIHGRASRGAPQKHLRIYGPEVFEDLTLSLPALRPNSNQDEYKNLILRAPDILFSVSLVASQLVQYIVRDLDFESLHNQACVTFINGNYWGIHYIEERCDKHFLAQHCGVNPDALDLIDWDRQAYVMEGNLDAFNHLMQELENNDMSSNSNYQNIADQLDIPCFIDYISAQIFFANEDFPVNNVRMWRSYEPDSKWRFIFFDADASMRQHWQNRLADFLSNAEKSDPVHIIFNALSKNPNFIKQFHSRFIYLLNGLFTPNNLLKHLEEFTEKFQPLVIDQSQRWHRPESYTAWENAIAQIRQFMLLRPPVMTDQLNQQFELPFTLFPNPCINQATIDFHSAISSDDHTSQNLFQIVFKSALGQAVDVPIQQSHNNVVIDTSKLQSGLYLVEVRMPMMTYVHRMIVQH
jgi:hypothetical protein